MRLRDYIFLTYRQFKTRKLRTFLTMFAIGVGIGTVFVLVSFVYGIQGLITERIAPTETLLTVDVLPGKIAKLDNSALSKVEKVSGVEDATPTIAMSGQASENAASGFADLTLNGVTAKFINYEGLKIASGRKFVDGQNEGLLTQAALSLFPDGEKIVGKEINIKALVPGENQDTTVEVKDLPNKITIVGIIEDKDTTGLYFDLPKLRDLQTSPNYTTIKVRVDRVENMESVKDQISALGFEAQAVYDTIEETSRLFNYVRVVFALLGLIGLFVAAIGMFNTLTISLLERTRDIGFMKAFGATNRDVKRLFLSEATIMGLGGGIIGVAVGALICFVVNTVINVIVTRAGSEALTIFVSPIWFTLFVTTLSAVLGFLTGIYPARRAEKISALEAIRYE